MNMYRSHYARTQLPKPKLLWGLGIICIDYGYDDVWITLRHATCYCCCLHVCLAVRTNTASNDMLV